MKTLFGTLFLAGLTFLALDLKAEIQYKLQNNNSGEAYFTVDAPGTVYVDVVHNPILKNISLDKSVISNIGYFHYDALVQYKKYSGDETGGPSRPNKYGSWISPHMPTLHYGDIKTGVLGEFKPGDKIVLFVETTDANGNVSRYATFKTAGLDAKDAWMMSDSGESIVFRWGDFAAGSPLAVPTAYEFVLTTVAPNGQPLPGIIATLLVGGGGLYYLHRRKKRSAAK